MTYFGASTHTGGLPRREGHPDPRDDAARGPSFGSRIDPASAALAAVRSELVDLRLRVPGVRGAVLAGVDGLLITHELHGPAEPHDLAALAATTFGLGRQSALVLSQSPFRDATLRSEGGYFTVYAVGDRALLAVLGDDGLNVARLHLEARPSALRLAALLR